MPVMMLGMVAGNTIFQKISRGFEPKDSAARMWRLSIARAPPSTFRTTVKNAPRKITKMMLSSVVGQKMIEVGTQASGGIGRRISSGGEKKKPQEGGIFLKKPTGKPSRLGCAKTERTPAEHAVPTIQH